MPANLLSAVGVSKSYPENVVLSDISVGIDDGDRLGIIGANGSGKTTLLSILAGQLLPDSGEVVRSSGTRVAYLEQQPHLPALTVSAFMEDHRTAACLDRLGVADPSRLIADMSGGQQRRVALALALASESEILILDEPTNHLDIEVIDWLEDELDRRTGAVVMVTHDRYLLDRVTNRVLEVIDGSLFGHKGTYQDFLEARAARDAAATLAARKRDNLAGIELAWLRRRPKARTTKAKARIDRAHELLATPPPNLRTEIELGFPSARLGSKVVELENAGVRFGEVSVLHDITWRLHPKARVGLVGPNGSGKTTLLRLLGGRIEPTAGKVELGETVSVGWFDQTPSPLNPDKRLIDTVDEVASQTKLDTGQSVSASQLLQRFGFTTSNHAKIVSDLSGGERRRLELLLVLAQAPNVLLLDEPTNDLDLDTLGAVERFLDNWPGVVVVASHDRYLLDRVCHDIVSIEPDGTIAHHPGGIDAYIRGIDRSSAPAGPTPRASAPRSSPSNRVVYGDRRLFQSLGELLPKLEESITAVEAELGGVGSDWQKAADLSLRLDELRAELAQAETQWLDFAHRIEG